MKCTIISGKRGSGKTGMILNMLDRTKDNLVVTNDPAVIYIEMYMARNRIPGRCIGINSLAKMVANDIGVKINKETTSEVEMAIISKIIHDTPLRTFSSNRYNSGLSNKIHSFITQCKEGRVSSDDLKLAASKSPKAIESKLLDIAQVYDIYSEQINKNNLSTKEDIIDDVISNSTNKIMTFSNIMIDTLDRYNQSTLELIEALVHMTENFVIAFNKTSKKAFEYDIYEEGMNAMVDFIDYVTTLPYCPIERIEATRKQDMSDGMNIIERELFNKDTETKSLAENVVLHEASTLYKEIDFVIAEINKLIAKGVKYSEIIIASSTMDRYINILGVAMKKQNIPYHYFKNTTVDKTSLFEFIDTVLDIKENDIDVNNLMKLCHLNFINLTIDEIAAVDALYSRFGDDLIVALENGKKYDAENTIIAQHVIQKIMLPINNITDSPKEVRELVEDLYLYLKNSGVVNMIENMSNDAKKDGFIHASSEIVNTWNDIMSIFSNMVTIFDGQELCIDEIRDIFYKMASEKISKNGETYHGQLTLLDIDNAQNRKSKYLFVIGANEGYMPRQVGEHIVTDRERVIINEITGKSLKMSSTYQNYKTAAIYNTLILPQEKIYISWSMNDIDFKPLRHASIINNIVKTFEDNIVREEDFYKNDEEERFITLLHNISTKRYKDKDNVGVDDEFMYFSSNPKYNRRLSAAINAIEHEPLNFHSDDVTKAYREKSYFSVSRIETYNECPFKHYVNFALNPTKKKLFAETAADKGSYNHLVFKEFFDKCRFGSLNVQTITYDEYLDELNKIFDELDENHNDGFLKSNSKNKYIAYSMKEKVKTALWMAIEQIRKGSYIVLANEYVVGKNISLEIDGENGNKYHITGVIDRVDTCNDNMRVIDYKSGQVEWSTEKLEAGIQLQLPIYSRAASKEGKITGMYYFRIKDFIADADGINTPLKDYKLSGPTLDSIDVLTDNDNDLESGKSSEVISAELTTKGEISKRSKTVSAQEMHAIMDKAIDIAKTAIDEISAGNTKAYPLQMKNFDACEYCKYKCLCGIDRTIKNATRKM